MITPTLDWEEMWWEKGYRQVAGVDEVGRGAWAGPVVAAAVVVEPHLSLASLDEDHPYRQVRDSKLLSPSRRQALRDFLIEQAGISFSIAQASVAEIDKLGIGLATYLAMERALAGLSCQADGVLVDGNRHPTIALPQQAIIKGDQKSFSIAAASIVAKVYRDDLMVNLDSRYPGYALSVHKGYGTAKHQAAIRQHGLSDIHRRSFHLTLAPR